MKVLIAGDFCPHGRIIGSIQQGDYSFFDEVRDEVANCDYSIVNLECPLIEGNQYKSIIKNGPALKGPAKTIQALGYAGFKAVTLANNHFRDYGDDGVKSTLDLLKHSDIEQVMGGGIGLKDADKNGYATIKGKRICIINVCENEFSIADAHRGGSSPLDVVSVSRRIFAAKQQSDYIVVIVHGGHELYQLPSPRMKRWYRFFVECGADAVVNHHQHCYSGYEYYLNKPIVYGLGNFCFDWDGKRNSPWNDGYMAVLNIEDAIKVELLPYVQGDNDAAIHLMKGKDLLFFHKTIEELNNIIQNDVVLEARFEEFCESKMHAVKATFSPLSMRILRGLAKIGVLPYFLSKKKECELLNSILCEAHRDVAAVCIQKEINA